MAPVKKTEGILIDFDGVIAKEAVDNVINFVYEYINRYTPLEKDYIKTYIKTVACFPTDNSIRFIFSAFGLDEQVSDFFEKFKNFDKNHNEFKIEEDFTGFIRFCEENNLQYKIFSLAAFERLKVVGNISQNNIYSLNNHSKASIHTFKEVENNMKTDLTNWLYLEDNPVALRTGKLAGLTTFMMLNNVFTEDDYNIFNKYIDYTVASFVEAQDIIQQNFL